MKLSYFWSESAGKAWKQKSGKRKPLAVYTEHFNNFLFCQLKLRLDPKDSIQTVFVVEGEGREQGALGPLFGDWFERNWYRVARLRRPKRLLIFFPQSIFPFGPINYAQDCSAILEPQQATKKTEQRHEGGTRSSKHTKSHYLSANSQDQQYAQLQEAACHLQGSTYWKKRQATDTHSSSKSLKHTLLM